MLQMAETSYEGGSDVVERSKSAVKSRDDTSI